MIALLVSLWVSAAPKDCKEDRACFDEAAKKCQPAKYTLRRDQAAGGMHGVTPQNYSINGDTSGGCELEVHVVFESMQIDPELVIVLGSETRAAATRRMEQDFVDRLLHDPELQLKCTLAPAEIATWVDTAVRKWKLRPDFDAKCTPLACPKLELARGCTLAGCTFQGPKFACGKNECIARSIDLINRDAVLSCEDGKVRAAQPKPGH